MVVDVKRDGEPRPASSPPVEALPDEEQANDPFKLKACYRNSEDLASIASNTSRRRVRQFYKEQNERIRQFLTPVDEHIQQEQALDEDDSLKVTIARQASLIANLLLAALQVYGASSSLSLSLFATMADAIFDPISNVSLVFWNWRMRKVDNKKYPVGNRRIENVGNIVFCWIMSCVSAVLVAISAIEIQQGVSNDRSKTGPTEKLHIPSLAAVAVAFGVKFCLFLYCWPFRKRYSQIYILWADHRNDLLINGFGILTAAGGSKVVWWLDPAGAIFISLLVITLWSRQSAEEFKALVGVSAETDMLQWITYISATHSSHIKAVDTVRAYHAGPRLIVEVDVVMDGDLPHHLVHDVAEELQTKLESLPNVERAYVHSDYETTHKPEHVLKKVL